MFALLGLISRLPLGILYGISDFLFLIAFYVWRYRRNVVQENLRKSFPEKSEAELRQIARRFYLNLTDVIVESIRVYSISQEEIKKRMRIRNPELLREYLNQKQTVLLCGAHQCNWEWISLICALHFEAPFAPLYKPLSNKNADKFMLHIRSRFGQKPISVGNTLQEIRRRRNEVSMIGFVADQAPTPGDPIYWTNFLNRDTGFFMGLEKVAYLMKYPVIFIGIRRLRRGYYEVFFEKIAEAPYEKDSHLITEKYARLTEKQILEAPSDWLWSHKRWKRPRVREDSQVKG